jgi:ATP-dependent DNA helicase RecG
MKQLRLSDPELEALAADIESDRVERKERMTGEIATKVREAICAFANDLPGHNQPGVVFIGLDDPGRPVGLPITDELLQQLADMRSDGNILPLPSLSVEKRQIAGADVAVVTVAPADAPPVRFKGRVHIRVGPRRALASRQDERILNERRIAADTPFDLSPVRGATVDKLDTRYFSEVYLRRAVAADVLAMNNRTEEEQLLATWMLDGSGAPVATVVGLLVLGREPAQFLPCAYVQFLRIDGTELSDPILDAAHYAGKVEQVHERVMDKLKAHIMVAVEIPAGERERRHESVPVAALQQLFANAIMHRSYEGTNAPIRVTWFNDRVEILSPGGPYGNVTVENFGRPGNADYRNPNLAAAMRNLGFVQRFGVGIQMAQAAVAAAGCPPIEWEVDSHWVRATVRKAQ